ncbi:MAG: hypothetical protein RLY43_1991 [Bacteroidota bacterium]|jgi:hypothetical protein
MTYYIESKIVRDKLTKVVLILTENEYVKITPKFMQELLANIMQSEVLINVPDNGKAEREWLSK